MAAVAATGAGVLSFSIYWSTAAPSAPTHTHFNESISTTKGILSAVWRMRKKYGVREATRRAQPNTMVHPAARSYQVKVFSPDCTCTSSSVLQLYFLFLKIILTCGHLYRLALHIFRIPVCAVLPILVGSDFYRYSLPFSERFFKKKLEIN